MEFFCWHLPHSSVELRYHLTVELGRKGIRAKGRQGVEGH